MKTTESRERTRRSYTAEERAKALQDAASMGVCAVARKHGIPQTTISGWQRAAKANGAAATSARVPSKGEEPIATPAPVRKPAQRYTPSEKARALEVAAARGVSVAARELGISRFAIYQWRRAVAKAAKGEGPSPTSGPAPADTDAPRDLTL